MPRKSFSKTAAAIALAIFTWAAPAQADSFCNNGNPEEACRTNGGTYHVRTPDGPGPFPAVVVLHSGGSSGEATIMEDYFVQSIVRRGFALIAPNGQPQRFANGTTGLGWNLRQTDSRNRNDAAFVRNTIENAAQRFRIDRNRVLLTGYGSAGSLVWQIACESPNAANAYAPIDGGFYEKMPRRCDSPVRIMQIYGRENGYWHFSGRKRVPANQAEPMPIDLHLELASDLNGCFGTEEVFEGLPVGFELTRWTGCKERSDLRFLVHDQGGALPGALFGVVLDWFMPPSDTLQIVSPPGAGSRFLSAGQPGGRIGKTPSQGSRIGKPAPRN